VRCSRSGALAGVVEVRSNAAMRLLARAVSFGEEWPAKDLDVALHIVTCASRASAEVGLGRSPALQRF
jgi:hypothetical protein